MGIQLSPKRDTVPQFLAHARYGQKAGCIKMPLGTEVGLGPGDIVLDGDPASSPSPRKKHSLQLSAHVCCGQTAVWIKMPFDREVGLGPGDTVRWGSSCRSPKGHSPQIFGPCLLWPSGWMDEGATLYASPCLWNQLPISLRQPHSSPSVSDFPADAPATSSYSLNLPLSPSITPSLFHSRLKTYLFHKSFPP